MAKLAEQLKTVLAPYYIGNVFLACLFFMLKTIPPFCTYLFYDCKLILKEWEYLTFLGCIIVLKNRKQVSFAKYVSTVCMFGKILNLVLFFKYNPAFSIVYVVLCLLQLIFLPEPMYTGPEYVTYFRGPHLGEELQRDRRIKWMITFYAAWSPPCVSFASVFSELSAEYALDNFKFGKIDVSRYPVIAEKFQIDCSSWSRQLPTVILFEDGKEQIRRPCTIKKHTLKFALTKENVIKEFNMNVLYDSCKKNPLPVRKKKKDE